MHKKSVYKAVCALFVYRVYTYIKTGEKCLREDVRRFDGDYGNVVWTDWKPYLRGG